MKLPRMRSTVAPIAAVGLLALAGALVVLSAPSSSGPRATLARQSHGDSMVTNVSTSPTTAKVAQENTPTTTETRQTLTPTDTPAPPPSPTATPVPTWHEVGSWSGNGAATAGKATIGSGRPVRYVYTCAETSPAWTMSIGFMSDSGAGGTDGRTICDGATHTLADGPYTDNPGGDGVYTISITAATGTAAGWSVTVEVYY